MNSRWTLLYYCYVDLSGEGTRDGVAAFFNSDNANAGIVGRVRVALDGVNATLGSTTRSALEAHVRAVQSHPLFGPRSIDFKFAPSAGARQGDATLRGCGFTDFTVRLCTEVVTLGTRPGVANASNAGTHLSPKAFHASLLGGGSDSSERGDGGFSDACPGPADVLIDARNAYETDIGTFAPPPGVLLLRPPTRAFAELPGWIDANSASFAGKRVLMMCTGGVRCEKGSAYLREAVPDAEVFQLNGGLQRYLEAAEAGALASASGVSTLFRGKLFVFDERSAVRIAGSEEPAHAPSTDVIGSCCCCECPWDDYAWLRCADCGVLVLVCDGCVSLAGGAELVRPFLQCRLPSCKGSHVRRGGPQHRSSGAAAADIVAAAVTVSVAADAAALV